jgi:diadenylate cyclase
METTFTITGIAKISQDLKMKKEKDKEQYSGKYGSYDKFVTGLDNICSTIKKIDSAILRSIIELAIEISREGREGRKIGTLFVIGDEEAVLKSSKTLILDPLKGHPKALKHIGDPNMRETIKELAQLDGAFIISSRGIAISATRYLDADSKGIELPLGLGSRHVAGASISKHTRAVAIVVSESSVVRLLNEGQIVAEIIPEQWFVQRVAGNRNESEN